MGGQGKAFIFSVLAGLAAAMASVFGKLAMDPIWIPGWFALILSKENSYFEGVTYVVRLLCFGLIVASSAILWNLLAKSMDLASSVDAVVINNAFNFFFSAVFGWLLFHED